MIRYDPSKILKKVASASKISKAVKSNLSLKKSVLVNTSAFDFLDKKELENVAMKTLKGYKKRVKEAGETASEIATDPVQLIQRVQNEVVFQVSNHIKDKFAGEFYEWIPSDADEPDPEHQLNYGLKFQVGVGEQPGDRYGCRCGMNILVDQTEL